MRSSAFSGLAILTISLLAKEVLAGRYDVRKRALVVNTVTDDVMITEEVTVVKEADGTYETGHAVIIGTSTINNIPVVISTTAPSVPAPTVSSVEIPSSAAVGPSAPIKNAGSSSSVVSSEAGGVFAQQPTPTPSPTSAAAVSVPVAPQTSAAPVPTTLATSSTPVATGSTSSSNKRGLAYNDASLLAGFLGTGSKASWAYNWASTAGGTVPAGLEYVPMLWGLQADKTSGWNAIASAAIKSGSSHLLSFNEPDLGPPNPQADLTWGAAADGYMQYMQPFAGQAKLGSPAVTNGPSEQGMGLAWLGNFTQVCTQCTIDFVNIHWYDSASNVDYFKSHVTSAYAAGGNRPVWITEFGASGSAAEQQTFLETVLPWLDEQAFVERYAYFGVFDGNLISSGTTLSPLGKTFAFSS